MVTSPCPFTSLIYIFIKTVSSFPRKISSIGSNLNCGDDGILSSKFISHDFPFVADRLLDRIAKDKHKALILDSLYHRIAADFNASPPFSHWLTLDEGNGASRDPRVSRLSVAFLTVVSASNEGLVDDVLHS